MQEFYDQRRLISDHWFPFREPVPDTLVAQNILYNRNNILYENSLNSYTSFTCIHKYAYIFIYDLFNEFKVLAVLRMTALPIDPLPERLW